MIAELEEAAPKNEYPPLSNREPNIQSSKPRSVMLKLRDKSDNPWTDDAKLFLKKHGFTTDRRGKKHIANLPDDVVSKHNLLKSGITISNERVVHIFDGKPYMDAHVLFSNMETAIMYPSRTMLDNDPCSFKLVREYEGRYLLYVVRKFDESMDETFENTIISGRIINEKQLRKEFGKEPK